MASQTTDFFQKLPFELRREIYRLVLQREQAVALIPNKYDRSFDASLFRVNKIVSEESRAVFFDINTVHVRPRQISHLISCYGTRIQNIHIEGMLINNELPVSDHLDAAATLMRYAKLTPQLKSITFECTGLGLTVRQLVECIVRISGREEFTTVGLACVKVGTYELRSPSNSQVWRFNYGLLEELWTSWEVSGVNTRLSPRDVENYFGVCGALRIPHWVTAKGEERLVAMQNHNVQGLAAQVARYGTIEILLPSLKPANAQLGVLRRFELLAGWKIKNAILETCVGMSSVIGLRDVREDAGSEVLEWATELLAPNVKDFAAEVLKDLEGIELVSNRKQISSERTRCHIFRPHHNAGIGNQRPKEV